MNIALFMIVSLVQILSSSGQGIVSDIRKNLASTNSNATGKTSQSIQYAVTESGTKTTLLVYGRPFVWGVETGRGPRKSSSNQNMMQNIREWMDVRNIGTDLSEARRESLARYITYKINKEGSQLYKSGGRKDIISNVIDDSLIGQISKLVMDQFSKAYMDNVKINVG